MKIARYILVVQGALDNYYYYFYIFFFIHFISNLTQNELNICFYLNFPVVFLVLPPSTPVSAAIYGHWFQTFRWFLIYYYYYYLGKGIYKKKYFLLFLIGIRKNRLLHPPPPPPQSCNNRLHVCLNVFFRRVRLNDEKFKTNKKNNEICCTKELDSG